MSKWFYIVSAVLLFCLVPIVQAAPSADLWEVWDAHDPQSSKKVSHDKWQSLLSQYLDHDTASGVNLFAYSDVTMADKRLLKDYLKELASLDPRSLNKTEQKAYWVNFYNALTVDVVLMKYPVSSIRKIRFLTSLFGPWNKPFIKVAGKGISLNDIEHRILRPIWQDSRIHFALNCASIGCPNLQPTVYTAQNIESQLEKASFEFLNNERALTRKGNVLVLSSIFDWYGDDFGVDEISRIKSLAKFLNNERLELLEGYSSVEYEYDWLLNNVK